MTEDVDIRWKQRFLNFSKALVQFQRFVEKKELNELELQGLIQCFEYTFELSWNVMRDFLLRSGNVDIYGSRDAIKIAFNKGLIEDGIKWMEMLKDRNKSTHTYEEEIAVAIVENIRSSYLELFKQFKTKMDTLC